MKMYVSQLFIILSFIIITFNCSKLDLLGDIFKNYVNEIKREKEIDLIFLVDASSSVGESNFLSELKFVRKLLSDLTVSKNQTNLAVITFGSKDSVVTHVNSVTTDNEIDKCMLLNEFLPNIQYSGGGTYTFGAFQEAKKIISEANRKNSTKALFLITDGFSNGGDPVPVADEVKKNYNVSVFTIGIKTGRCDELQKLATRPETCFLLGDYKEFESLARRALHADLRDGEYVPVSKNKCGGICDEEFADCTCGSGSGQYACKCRRGYYGNGVQCQSCPKGTWYRIKDGFCVPCPDPNHESHNALSQTDCKCKRGYKDNEHGMCEIVRCPELKAPENGYFVGIPAKSKKCFNILNNACGMRCEVGYSLRGNSIRLCQENGIWSGIQPQCELKKCLKPPMPNHGKVFECVNKDLDTKYDGNELPNDLPVDTECTFGCNTGHMAAGSTLRTCLPVEKWDGLRTACKPIRCHRLGTIPNGHWKPTSCTTERQPFGSICSLACKSGFSPNSKELICDSTGKGPGKWIGTTNRCVDNEPPAIRCPKDHAILETEPSMNYGIGNWSAPKVADNTDQNITVWLEPSEENETGHESNHFEIGTTWISYHAVDSAGNEAICNMSVEVLDKEPPVIENCESPPPFLTSDPSQVVIQWDEPLAFDNSQEAVEMIKSHEFGVFPVGTTEVTYKVVDKSNNTNSCVINITVIAEASCERPPNETAICSSTPVGVTCALTCPDGYGFALTDKAICLHDTPGIWDVPECTPAENPLEEWEVINAVVDCVDNKTGQEFEKIVKEEGGVTIFTGCERIRRNTENLKRLQQIELHVKNTNKVLQFANDIGVNVTIGTPIIICKNGSILSVRSPGQNPRCALCPRGTYYSNKRCVPCPPDAYAKAAGSLFCEPCPTGRSTLGRKRAKSIKACKAKCPPNLNKSQKGTTCVSRARKRVSCERSNVCKNNGKCVPVGGHRHKCVCAPGWVGARCRVRARSCFCQNGGVCTEDGSKCICKPDFVGEFCELHKIDLQPEVEIETTDEPINPCRLIQGLCENNGTCLETEPAGFQCKCLNGYIGRRCNILPCDYNPCPSSTICTNINETNATKSSYKCICPEGQHNPPECTQIQKCRNETCLNGGVCKSFESDECECLGKYYGKRCELEKDSNFILFFPRSSINDYVITEGPVANLSEISFCVWLQTNDEGNYGTILSYATDDYDNAFTVTDYSGLVVYVNGYHVVTDVRLNDGHWHHLCITWTTKNGTYHVYVDSRIKAIGQGLSNGVSIAANGKIVLGQEQDSLGGKYSRAESFIGKLTYVDIWDKILTKEEVAANMYDCASTGTGTVRTWAEFRDKVYGFIQIENNTFCGVCSPPKQLENGEILMEAHDQRSITYKCDQGFVLKLAGIEIQGSLKRKCTVTTEWEHIEPLKCEPISCPYPGYVPYAQVSGAYRDFKYKDQLIYKCVPGYEPKDPQIRICTENGTWSGLKPLCRGGQCETFDKPSNSNITVISEHVYDDEFEDIALFEVGTQLEISCLNGVIQGEKLLSCQENGTWDFSVPTCEIPGCLATEMPQVPTNGYSLNEVSGVIFEIGTVISFKCRIGHNHFGNNQTQCLEDGKWSFLNLTCKPIQCTQPPIYENMFHQNDLNLNLNETKYHFNNLIKYECNEGYTFYGNNVIRCLANGKWSKIKGQCIRISCNKPNVAEDETIIGDSYLYKDSLTILCPKNSKYTEYSMNCTNTGKWLQTGECN